MSTRHEIYLMAAVALNWDRYIEIVNESDGEAFDGLDVPWRGEGAEGKMGILADGMGGKYVLAGKVIAVSNDEGEGFNLVEVQAISQEAAFEVAEWLSANDLMHLVDIDNLTIRNYLVSHWH